MTTAGIIMWGVVLLVGLPSAWRNATALALVASWAIAQWWWLVTGDNIPLAVYFLCDTAVMAVILAKPARAWSDGVVLTIFLPMWVLYVAPLTDHDRWWLLWGLAIAQFMAVGCQGARGLLAAAKGRNDNEAPPGALRFAWGRHVSPSG